MNELIDFVCIRIASELNKFQRTKTIPHDLLDGTYTINDINDCMPQLSPRHQKIAKKLISEYSNQTKQSLESLREALKKEYASELANARTRDHSFWFPQVANQYRPDINPVRALYYETRELTRRFNPEDEKHIWLSGLLSDKQFLNILIDALEHDIKRLERLLKRYYWPMLQHDDKIPLELFHARQLIKDARHYHTFFQNTHQWLLKE